MHMHIYIHSHMYMHIHMHTYTHTRTYIGAHACSLFTKLFEEQRLLSMMNFFQQVPL